VSDFVPEIVNDELARLVTELVVEYTPETIIEIGSANGLGSTQAFIKGVERAGIEGTCTMYCLEIIPERYRELLVNTKKYSFVQAVNASSVEVSEFMKPEEISCFLSDFPHLGIRQYGEDTVKGWLAQDIRTIKNNNLETGWLGKAFAYNQIGKESLVVLIDGSAFTGSAEFESVLGADVIIMDDTMDIKCWGAYERAKSLGEYELINENKQLRNGYAVFKRAL